MPTLTDFAKLRHRNNYHSRNYIADWWSVLPFSLAKINGQIKNSYLDYTHRIGFEVSKHRVMLV